MTTRSTAPRDRTENKVAIALAVREAMCAHRKGKPIAFTFPTRPKHGEARQVVT